MQSSSSAARCQWAGRDVHSTGPASRPRESSPTLSSFAKEPPLQISKRRPQIVIGRFPDADPAALAAVVGLYRDVASPCFVVDVEAAEVIKNGANAFLALKLSFANEMAALCEEAGTDIDDVLAGITADPRIGGSYMRPSFGFGGSCLPKELATLALAGRDLGLPMHVTTAAATANLAQQTRFAEQIAGRLDGVAGKTVAVLGLAFKSDTDDVRKSRDSGSRACSANGAHRSEVTIPRPGGTL